MTEPLVIELPWPPSDNRLIRHAVLTIRHGHQSSVRDELEELISSKAPELLDKVRSLLDLMPKASMGKPIVTAYPSEEAKAYRMAVDAILADKGLTTLKGPLGVGVDLYPPDRRKIDPANRLKALLDSLKRRETGRRKKGFSPAYDPKQKAWLFASDDSQAVQGGWRLCPVVSGGKAIVTLTPAVGVEVQPTLFADDDDCPPPEGVA